MAEEDQPKNFPKVSFNVPVNNQEEPNSHSTFLLDKHRRQSIIPPTHQPKKLQQIPNTEYEQESFLHSYQSFTVHDNQNPLVNDRVSSILPGKNQNNVDISSIEKSTDNINCDTNGNENNFDSFIFNNFTRYSGDNDINVWLDEIVRKFNRLQIPHALRFNAIPSLVEGAANKVYVKNRRNIHSFHDFQELLLLHFDKSEEQPISTHSQVFTLQQSSSIKSTVPGDAKNSDTYTTFNNSQFSENPPKYHSTALTVPGAVTFCGEAPVVSSTINPNLSTPNINSTNQDDTTNVLRKVLLHNLMTNPKTFEGGKADVTKWLEDLEHLFDVAHISDANKLDLVSYSLRGEALQWFKNNKSSFTSWKIFVAELKSTFVSIYHEELAFKKLESYTQTETQSICNFYNEVIRLCNEADPNMNDSTKLKHLLNKTKPTVQFEVRRKKPITTKEFLEYAKEIEELHQLININTNTTTSPQLHSPQNPSSINTPRPNWKKFDSNYYSSYDNSHFRPTYTPYHSNAPFRSQQSGFTFHNQPKTHSQSDYSTQNFNYNRSNRSSIYNNNNNNNNNNRLNNSQRLRTTPRINQQQNNINNLTYSNTDTQFPSEPLPSPTEYDIPDQQVNQQRQSHSNF